VGHLFQGRFKAILYGVRIRLDGHNQLIFRYFPFPLSSYLYRRRLVRRSVTF
jgi:hypothetical protein